MNDKNIRTLLVEDAVVDAELIVRELKRAGMSCDARRVEIAADFRRELEEFRPQVILSDFSMPAFDGMEALKIASQLYAHIPFIFVSGTLGEEHAVRALKSGARDYVLKSNLLRLPAAVERAIKETEERRARQTLERELRESEKLYRALFQNNPHPMWVYDMSTLRILAVNDAALARYAFSRDEFMAMTIADLHPDNKLPEVLDPAGSGLAVNAIEQHRTKKGQLINAEITSSDVLLEGKGARIVVARILVTDS